MAADAVPWSVAWRRAAHGPHGFYGAPHGRAEDHFVTPVMSGDAVATRLVELAVPVLSKLAADGMRVTVTDAGAADGTLIGQLRSRWPESLRPMTQWRGIDVRSRPTGLDAEVAWVQGDIVDLATDLPASPGMLVAHELLDDIPCDIVEPDEHGRLRLVLVDASTGHESLGPSLDDLEACQRLGVDGAALGEWCAQWWPRGEPVARIEVGRARDLAWRSIGSLVTDGLAVAIDYGHVLTDRAAGRWDGGTLAAYVDGRLARPLPDGLRNLTAHVAMDACASALSQALTTELVSSSRDDFWWLVQSLSSPA